MGKTLNLRMLMNGPTGEILPLVTRWTTNGLTVGIVDISSLSGSNPEKRQSAVFGEYDAHGHVESTGKPYKQTYAGLLVAEHGKIKLLREALDTLAASRAFSTDGV